MEKLLQIVKDINEKTDYAVSFHYSGYANSIHIYVYKGKNDLSPLYSSTIYSSTIYIGETFGDTYEEVEKQLKNFLPINIETYEKK